jgi:competence protein ComFB
MELQSMYSFDELTNEAERLVIEELGRQLEGKDGVCLSEECVLDMAAYALNQVRPLYRVNLVGRLYAPSMKTKYEEEVRKAVTAAITRISKE